MAGRHFKLDITLIRLAAGAFRRDNAILARPQGNRMDLRLYGWIIGNTRSINRMIVEYLV